MSTIKSSDEHLTLNADGSSKDIKFQANGVEKASISSAGAFTSTTIDATKLTGNLPAISGAALTGVGVAGITSAADATAITISSAEKVGIGETSPTTHLLCLGEDSGSGDSGASSGISFRASNTENYISMSTVGGGNNGARGLIINREGSNELIKFCGDGRGLSQFTAKVWVHIDSGALADGHNVSSITDNGTGEYQVNFANNLANDNYSSTTSNPYRNGSSRRALVNTYNPNVNNINIAVFEYNHSNSNGFYAYDLDKCTMTIFGD